MILKNLHVVIAITIITIIATSKTQTVSAFSAAAAAVPSWDTLQSLLPSTISKPAPCVYTYEEVTQDPSLLNNDNYILYRDVNANCPYAQRVWLALELKQLNYITVLTSSPSLFEEEEHPYGPRLRLPNGNFIYDSIQALEEIQKLTVDVKPNLFPRVSGSVDGVRANINRRAYIFPRNTIMIDDNLVPSLFTQNNKEQKVELVSKTNHDVTCEEIDEMLEEYPDGPYLCGAQITAADIAWIPFVERYVVQLPMIYPDVVPRSNDFGEIKNWLDALERDVPCYSCVVRGDVWTYGSQLHSVVEQHDLDWSKIGGEVPNKDFISIKRRQKRKMYNPNDVWESYAKDKDYLADKPNEECAACIFRLRDSLLSQLLLQQNTKGGGTEEEMDAALRQVVHFMLTEFTSSSDEFGYKEDALSKLSGDARDVASRINDCICVPRDMGAIPASVLRKLVLDAPKPRI